MYLCEDCGETFDFPYIKRIQVGEEPYDCEEFGFCPCCESENFFEADQCIECGEYFDYAETDCHLCKDCKEKAIAEYSKSPKKCFDLCKIADKMEVSINSFLYYVYEPEEIEEILLEHLKGDTRKCQEFIEGDEDYFFDLIEEQHDLKEYEKGVK